MRKLGLILFGAVAVLFVVLPLIVACRGEDRKFFSRPGDVPAASELEQLRSRVKDLESQLLAAKAPVDSFSIAGLGELKPSARPVQWVITSAPGCGHCPANKRQLKHRLKDWDVSDSPDAHFRLVEITDAEWRERGITLPLSELYVNGRIVATRTGVTNPDELAGIYNQWANGNVTVPDPEEKSYGIGVGSVPVKAQISALLQALKPFLDGGTLRVEYKPRAGVIRDWLTVKQGAVGVKIPSTTAIVFAFEGDQFVGRFEGTAPRLIVGPFERGPTSVEVSTDRIAIRLPWCPDPEIKLTE